LSLEETQNNSEEQTPETLVLSENTQPKEFDEKKTYTHIGLGFSVFYYSTFQIIGTILSVILLLIAMTVRFIEVDGDGNYNPNSTNVIYILLAVNLLATLTISFLMFGLNKRMKFIPSKVSFSLTKSNWKLLGFGAALMFFFVGGIQLLVSLIQEKYFPEITVETPYDFFNSNNIGILIFATVLVSIAAPIAEEIFYRWTMIQTLKKGMNKYATIIFSSLIFAFAHSSADLSYSFYYFILHFVGTFLIGLILGTIYFLTNKIILTVILHATWNFIISLSALFSFYNLYNVYFIIYLVLIGLSGIITIVGSIFLLNKRRKKQAFDDSKEAQIKTKIKLRPEWFTLILGYFMLVVLLPWILQIITDYYSFGNSFILIVYLGLLMVLSILLVIQKNGNLSYNQRQKSQKTLEVESNQP